jgi:hypothetical protein
MPRPVAIRVSYRDDAGYLLRLEAAVVKDERQTQPWRDETAKLIRQLSMRLLEADASKNMGGDRDKKGGRSESLKIAAAK